MKTSLDWPVPVEKYNQGDPIHTDVAAGDPVGMRRLSPFMIPNEVHVVIDPTTQHARFDFDYPDREPAGETVADPSVSLSLGKNSWKILSASFNDLGHLAHAATPAMIDLFSSSTSAPRASEREILQRHAIVVYTIIRDLVEVLGQQSSERRVSGPRRRFDP